MVCSTGSLWTRASSICTFCQLTEGGRAPVENLGPRDGLWRSLEVPGLWLGLVEDEDSLGFLLLVFLWAFLWTGGGVRV